MCNLQLCNTRVKSSRLSPPHHSTFSSASESRCLLLRRQQPSILDDMCKHLDGAGVPQLRQLCLKQCTAVELWIKLRITQVERKSRTCVEKNMGSLQRLLGTYTHCTKKKRNKNCTNRKWSFCRQNARAVQGCHNVIRLRDSLTFQRKCEGSKGARS